MLLHDHSGLAPLDWQTGEHRFGQGLQDVGLEAGGKSHDSAKAKGDAPQKSNDISKVKQEMTAERIKELNREQSHNFNGNLPKLWF